VFDEDKYKALGLGLQGIEPAAAIPSNRLEAILRYAARGLPVFPCEPQSKAPSLPHGFRDATTNIRPFEHPRLKSFAKVSLPNGDYELINARNNLAIEPGQIGCTVVDIDPKNGGDAAWAALEAEHGPVLPRAVSTPSGGRHLWFRGIITAVNKKLGPGIDTRCFGGYVLLPPSSVRGKRYEWVDDTVPIAPLPEWARETLEAQDEDADAETDTAFEAWQAAEGDGGRFEFLLSRIGDEASGGEGFYNPMLKAAGHGVRRGMALDEVVERVEEAALSAPRGKRTLYYIKEKVAELRHNAVRKFRQQDQARDAERKAFEEAEAEAATQQEEVAEEPRPFSGGTEWISPEAAIASLRAPIQAWLDRDRGHEKTLTILQSAAGLGKTQTMLEEQQRAQQEDRKRAELEDAAEQAKLQRIVDDLEENLADLPPPPLGKLACAAPRQKLAQEIQAIDRGLRQANGDEEQIPILQGRNASNCQRYELVVKAQKKGFEPSALCHQTLPNGEEVYCPFYEKCSTDPTQYLANQTEVN
jgi:hypothetical protein